jgi:hypothetical protein
MVVQRCEQVVDPAAQLSAESNALVIEEERSNTSNRSAGFFVSELVLAPQFEVLDAGAAVVVPEPLPPPVPLMPGPEPPLSRLGPVPFDPSEELEPQATMTNAITVLVTSEPARMRLLPSRNI